MNLPWRQQKMPLDRWAQQYPWAKQVPPGYWQPMADKGKMQAIPPGYWPPMADKGKKQAISPGYWPPMADKGKIQPGPPPGYVPPPPSPAGYPPGLFGTPGPGPWQ